jgi:hypothetical protein
MVGSNPTKEYSMTAPRVSRVALTAALLASMLSSGLSGADLTSAGPTRADLTRAGQPAGDLTRIGLPVSASASAALPSGEVNFCFRKNDGSPFTGDVSARVEVGTSWQTRETRRSVNGCFTWPVESGFVWTFRAHATVGKVRWNATTRPVMVKSGTRHDAGVYVVSQSSR